MGCKRSFFIDINKVACKHEWCDCVRNKNYYQCTWNTYCNAQIKHDHVHVIVLPLIHLNRILLVYVNRFDLQFLIDTSTHEMVLEIVYFYYFDVDDKKTWTLYFCILPVCIFIFKINIFLFHKKIILLFRIIIKVNFFFLMENCLKNIILQ